MTLPIVKRTTAIAACASLALSACSSSGPSTQSQILEQRMVDKSMAFTDISARVTDAGAFPIADVPTTGAVTFAGSVGVTVFTTPQNTALVGDANLTLDFGADDVTGSLDDFVGTDHNGNTADYDGSISIYNGDIGVSESSVFAAEMDGTVTQQDTAFVFDGNLLGILKGNAQEIAIQAASTADVTVNDTPTAAQVSIAGAQD